MLMLKIKYIYIYINYFNLLQAKDIFEKYYEP
jgi:hypothetical protein